jgi:Mg-chelatase subunit ChlD
MKKIYLVMGLITTIFLLDNTTVGANQQDIIFVLDNSGSMHKNNPDIIRNSIISTFITRLHKTDRVGIVIFDESARLAAPLTLLDNPTTNKKLSGALAQMNYRGQLTNSPAAIERAVYELHTNERKDSQRSIIFLTDGIIDTGNANKDAEMTQWLIENLTTECVDLGIKIFGIAFTEKADFHLIQSLAGKTKGAYFHVLKANDISNVFKEILGLLPPPSNSTSATVVKPGNRTDQHARLSTNITTVTIKKKEPASIFTSLLRSLGWTILILFVLAAVSLLVTLFLRQKKKHILQRTSTAPRKEDDSQNLKPEAQLLGLNKTGMDNSEPQPLYLIDKREITIGRDPKNVIVIPKPTVSNFHATIYYIDGHFQLKDHHSTNGTFVKNSRLAPDQPVRLKHGDIVKFATFDFRFLNTDRAAATEAIMLTERLNRNHS